MRRIRSIVIRGLWLGALTSALPASTISAQGFGLNEIGTCALSRGFAVTGSPCSDASTIFWNPAAAAELTGKSISVGASAIIVKGSFHQDSTGLSYPSNVSPGLPPAGFAAMRIGKGSIGVGLYVPYGLTSQWHGDFPGRFSALRAALQTIYIQPNVAYQLTDNWSVGGGPIIGHSTVDLTQAIDLSQQQAAPNITFGQLGIAYGTEFARAQVHGTSTAFGYNLGVHGKYGPWSVGARYLSALKFKYDKAAAQFSQTATLLTLPQGNPVSPTGSPVPIDALLRAQFASGGRLVDQTGSSKITHPWQVQAGVGYNGFANTKLSADLTRTGWSAFSTLPITFDGPAATSSRELYEGFHDSWTYRFGAERNLGRVTGRIGYSYAESPAPDISVTPLLPDMNRQNIAVGIEIPVADIYKLDIGYLHVNTPGRRGRIAENPVAPSGLIVPIIANSLNTGAYSLKADVISVALNVNF